MALTLSYCIIIIIIPTFRYIRRPRHSATAVQSLPTCPPSTWDMAAENSHLCIKLVRNTQHLIAKCYSTRGLCAMLLLKGTIRRMVSEQVRKSSWFLLFVTFRSVLIFSSAPDPELQCWSRPNLGWWSVPGITFTRPLVVLLVVLVVLVTCYFISGCASPLIFTRSWHLFSDLLLLLIKPYLPWFWLHGLSRFKDGEARMLSERIWHESIATGGVWVCAGPWLCDCVAR